MGYFYSKIIGCVAAYHLYIHTLLPYHVFEIQKQCQCQPQGLVTHAVIQDAVQKALHLL
jgi:hypothetical protein